MHNDVNEITSIGASVGTNWADPTYDAAGNMVTCPKPNDPANSFTLRWDAWNRLVKVLDGANTVAEYEYDGMNRRIVKKLYTGGTLTQTRHRYHTPGQDQVIEERVAASSNADRQFTWGTRYIDDLVMRTRDTNADGTLDETLYALTDITYDVVALTDATGAVVERFLYDPYGKSTVLDANFALDSDSISDYDWEYRFTSREYDKETGLDYFRARYYSSGQGRFVNRDPLGYPDGMNTYAGYFVQIGMDPTGEGNYGGVTQNCGYIPCPYPTIDGYDPWVPVPRGPTLPTPIPYQPHDWHKEQHSKGLIPSGDEELLSGIGSIAKSGSKGLYWLCTKSATSTVRKVLTKPERLRIYFDRLKNAPAPQNPDEALECISKHLDDVEDEFCRILKSANPGKGYTGRMYPPQADNITRMADGSMNIRTKGNRITIECDGSFTVYDLDGNEILRKCGVQ